MRRVLSILFFVCGGWMLSGEPLFAFLSFGPATPWLTPVMLGLFLVLAAVPLAVGTALSPGERSRELGLTMLLSIGFAAVGAVSAAAVLFDPGAKMIWAEVGPMPDIRITPIVGTANLMVMTAVAWLLYRRRGQAAG